jgi:hypothetical protein
LFSIHIPSSVLYGFKSICGQPKDTTNSISLAFLIKITLDSRLVVVSIPLLILYVLSGCTGRLLDRSQVVALLKEMLLLGIVQPSFVSVEKNDHGTFNLTMKAEGNLLDMRSFLLHKNLLITEDKEKGICTIYKP